MGARRAGEGGGLSDVVLIRVASLIAAVIIVLATIAVVAILSVLNVAPSIVTTLLGFIGPTVVALLALARTEANAVAVQHHDERLTKLENGETPSTGRSRS